MPHKHSLHESIEITDCHSSYTVLLFFDKALVSQCFVWALAIIGNKSQMRKMKLFCRQLVHLTAINQELCKSKKKLFLFVCFIF